MRLIDADALIDDMAAGCIPLDERGISGVTGDNTCIRDYVNAAPTIEAEPIKHGYWIEGKRLFDYYFKCSSCHGNLSDKIYPIAPDRCPYCNAKMDLKEESE